MDKYTRPKTRAADVIREHVRTAYVEPALRKGEKTVSIVAGDIVHDLNLRNRTPAVCSALRSQAFLNENHLTIEKDEGPPSGMSTTVKITYRLPPGSPVDPASKEARRAWFESMRGIGKDTYAALGGAEAFIRSLREDWKDG